jgi:hypothetical protein
VASADDAIFRVQANGATYADGAYTGTGADYAEWFEKEGGLSPKDIVGLNLATGKVHKYQPGDVLVGVYSQKPGFVGNQPLERTDEEMKRDYALVSLMGQVDIDDSQMRLENGKVYTQDGIQLGYRLANGKVLLRM